jgi:hypothetical protein
MLQWEKEWKNLGKKGREEEKKEIKDFDPKNMI